jgi:hypothetical protein
MTEAGSLHHRRNEPGLISGLSTSPRRQSFRTRGLKRMNDQAAGCMYMSYEELLSVEIPTLLTHEWTHFTRRYLGILNTRDTSCEYGTAEYVMFQETISLQSHKSWQVQQYIALLVQLKASDPAINYRRVREYHGPRVKRQAYHISLKIEIMPKKTATGHKKEHFDRASFILIHNAYLTSSIASVFYPRGSVSMTDLPH